MAASNPADQPKPQQTGVKNRPFYCIAFVTVALTWFLALFLLFLTGLLYQGRISGILSLYESGDEKLIGSFTVFTSTGAFLFLAACAGLLVMLLKKRWGFYLFFGTSLVILGLDFAFLAFDWMRYLAVTGLIFLIGLSHFSRRCYR